MKHAKKKHFALNTCMLRRTLGPSYCTSSVSYTHLALENLLQAAKKRQRVNHIKAADVR